MTARIVRVLSCPDCPHFRAGPDEAARCSATTEDYHGIAQISRRFRPGDRYPEEIPEWCPLEEAGA